MNEFESLKGEIDGALNSSKSKCPKLHFANLEFVENIVLSIWNYDHNVSYFTMASAHYTVIMSIGTVSSLEWQYING